MFGLKQIRLGELIASRLQMITVIGKMAKLLVILTHFGETIINVPQPKL